MAKVWLCYEGNDPTIGPPLVKMTVTDCAAKLDLRQTDFLSDPSNRPRFGNLKDPMNNLRGYRHVVVELDENEAETSGWRPGFYHAKISPQEAHEKCTGRTMY